MMNAALRGKPDAGNPHVRFDEGEVVSEKPRRGSLLYKFSSMLLVTAAVVSVSVAQAAPSFCLPDRIYAVAGTKCSVFFTRVFDSVTPGRYAFEALSDVGNFWHDHWSWTPSEKDAGKSHRLVLNAWTDDGLYAAATTTVVVAKAPTEEQKQRKIRAGIFSASCTNCRWQDYLRDDMRNAGFAEYDSIGSHTGDSASMVCDTTKGAPHDGYGGFAWGDFLDRYAVTVDEIDNLQAEAEKEQLKSFGVKLAPGNEWRKALLKSPIVRVRDGKKVVDVQAWLDKVNGGAAPDYLVIMLGGNGVECVRPEKIEASVKGQIEKARELVAIIRKACPKTVICVTSAFGCSSLQEGWGRNYGARFSAFQGNVNIILYNRAAEKFVRESGDPLLKYCAISQNIDPVKSYPTGKYANAGHAMRETGGKAAGEAIYAWMVNDLTTAE